MNSEDGQVYSVCILQFSCFTKYNRMQSKHKQTKFALNLADETLTNYSFLRRYHFTKSKNYLKRRYRIRHWIPMFFGTPCRICILLYSWILIVRIIRDQWIYDWIIRPVNNFIWIHSKYHLHWGIFKGVDCGVSAPLKYSWIRPW